MSLPVRVGTATVPDGAVLAWRADGEGPLALIACNGIGVATLWRPLAGRFAATGRCTFITWDYRGRGASPVAERPEEMTIQQCARDLWSVLDAAGFQRAVLLGHSMGVQVILEAYRQRSGEVRALVPMFGAAGEVFRGQPLVDSIVRLAVEVGAANAAAAEQALRIALGLPGVWPALQALGIVHPDLSPRESLEPYLDHLRSLDLRGYFSLARDLLSHDASDVLDQVRVPALVVAGDRDLFAPVERSREIAMRLPGAELLVLRGGTHASLVEQPELIFLRLEKFLDAHQIA